MEKKRNIKEVVNELSKKDGELLAIEQDIENNIAGLNEYAKKKDKSSYIKLSNKLAKNFMAKDAIEKEIKTLKNEMKKLKNNEKDGLLYKLEKERDELKEKIDKVDEILEEVRAGNLDKDVAPLLVSQEFGMRLYYRALCNRIDYIKKNY